jgi:type II secretory ATPase GspE/PulE/Tfp pilus assembly ATPase PilB-like protein
MSVEARFKEIPATTIVQELINLAIARHASDIHLEPTADILHVRFRLDGLLYPIVTIRSAVMHQVISHIKVLAHLNIAQKKIPQDGKFRVHHRNREIDIRVSSFPTLWGEKVVLRILDRLSQPIALDKLGLCAAMYDAFHAVLKKSNGFFLVSGPTGSGKTTTLYAVLHRLHDSSKHIITLEDPIEYQVMGITQGQIYPPAGFTFESGMRALLRQDPDIVMIGEIRDQQTAGIAIEASLTGHVVLSTIHTNDAPSVIMRLMDMGIEPFLINASITGVLAQRLCRVLCAACKVQVPLKKEEQEMVAPFNYPHDYHWQRTGCAQCNQIGYKGRMGIFELMLMTDQLRALIVQQPSFEQIKHQALADGLITLHADALDKVANGVISLEEMMRVVV